MTCETMLQEIRDMLLEQVRNLEDIGDYETATYLERIRNGALGQSAQYYLDKCREP